LHLDILRKMTRELSARKVERDSNSNDYSMQNKLTQRHFRFRSIRSPVMTRWNDAFMKFQRIWSGTISLAALLALSTYSLIFHIRYIRTVFASVDLSLARACGNKLCIRRQSASLRRVYYRCVSPCGIRFRTMPYHARVQH